MGPGSPLPREGAVGAALFSASTFVVPAHCAVCMLALLLLLSGCTVYTTDVPWSVCQPVSELVTAMSHANTAERIDMPFGLWARGGPGNHVLDGGPDLPRESALLGHILRQSRTYSTLFTRGSTWRCSLWLPVLLW